MKTLRGLLAVCLSFAFVFLAGCSSSSSSSSTPSGSSAAASSGVSRDTEKPQASGAKLLTEDQMKNISFVVKEDMAGVSQETAYSLKDNKMKSEFKGDSGSTFYYVDFAAKTNISYDTMSNIAMKMTIGSEDSATNNNPLKDYADFLSKLKPTGTQMVEGVNCDVYDVTDMFKGKYYVNHENGYPVKQDGAYAGVKMTAVFSNVKCGSVTDADVTLPSNIKVEDFDKMDSDSGDSSSADSAN